jgi:hypothetical protein
MMTIFYSCYEYIKIIFTIVVNTIGVLIDIPIALLTLYSLAGAFMPYQTLEQNLAQLLMFLTCVSYWVWKYLTRNEEVSFWKIF